VEKQTTVIGMNDRASLIHNLMWKEVALKSRSAAIAFGALSIVVFFYHFNLINHQFHIQVACILAILSSIMRFMIAAKMITSEVATKEQVNTLRLTIWLNSLAWSFIFSISAYELNSNSFHFALLMAILTGFISSSIVTLAYDKSIFFPFQVLLIFPLMCVALYQYFTGLNLYGFHIFIIYLVLFLYQLKQYKDYRNQLMQRFETQLDLEFSFVELKKSQATLVDQTAKLIHASKISALSEMAGGLAHEVNNSLMVIMGSAQQVQRELKRSDLLTASIDSKIQQSTNAILKIKAVIEGLKYFSLQMGPQPKEPVELKEIINRTLSYTHELVKAHNISFSVDPIPDVQILCHPFQITQILFNITKNADDAMSSLVGPKWLKYEFERAGDDILIRIINNGTPIPPENHMKLFQPFFSTKDVNKGSGLSLSVAKGIAMDHHGDLYYVDEEFTTFVLKLPVAKA
jgi:signal transduction histidine kinase